MDLVIQDREHNDIGTLHDYDCDFDVTDTMDWIINTGISNNKMKGGYYWYIQDTEFGGKVDKYKVITASNKIQYYGRSIRSMLTSKVIEPPEGSDYKIVSGTLSEIVQGLIHDAGYDNLFYVEPTSVVINNYKFERYINTYSGINSLCFLIGYVASFIYDNKGVCHISFKKPNDYTDDKEFTSNDVGFEIEKSYAGVNHLICLGKGELKNRTVIHLYIDGNGNISDKQYYFGEDEITEVYDYSNAEDENTLKIAGEQKLLELSNSDNLSVTLDKSDLKIGDIVGGIERLTETYASAKVTNMIAKITEDGFQITHVIGEDKTSSGASSSTRSDNDRKLIDSDNIQIIVQDITHVYKNVTEIHEEVVVLSENVKELKLNALTVDSLAAKEGDFGKIDADSGFVKQIFSESILSNESITKTLQSNVINAELIKTISLDVEEAVTRKLETDFLKADISNIKYSEVETEKVQNLFVKSGWFDKSVIEHGYAFELVGDLVKANTLALQELIFVDNIENPTRNMVYHLNELAGGLDKESYSDEELSKKLNGKDIIANSITSEQINVKDLFAQEITATGTIKGAKLYGAYGELIEGYIGGENQGFEITSDGLTGVRQNGIYRIKISPLETYNSASDRWIIDGINGQLNYINILSSDSQILYDVTNNLKSYFSFDYEISDDRKKITITSINIDYPVDDDVTDIKDFFNKYIGISDLSDDNHIIIQCVFMLSEESSDGIMLFEKYLSRDYTLSDENISSSVRGRTGTTIKYDSITTDNIIVTGGIIEGLERLKSKTIYENGTSLSEKYLGITAKAESAKTADSVAWTGVSGRPTKLSAFTNDSGYITSTGSCASATKATQDGNGNNIVNTYATKTELKNGALTTYEFYSGIYANSYGYKVCNIWMSGTGNGLLEVYARGNGFFAHFFVNPGSTGAASPSLVAINNNVVVSAATITTQQTSGRVKIMFSKNVYEIFVKDLRRNSSITSLTMATS